MAINSVTLSGNLTKDAELRRTQSGTSVLNASMAVNNRRKNGNGEWVDEPCFVDFVLFGSRAEKLEQYLTKGTKVCIHGGLRYSQWERDGQKRSKLDVVADEIEFMTRNQNQSRGYQGGYDDHHQQVRQQQAEYVEATYYDDDCPFN